MPAPPILTARVPRAAKRQQRQKSRAAAYRAAPHHYAPPPRVRVQATRPWTGPKTARPLAQRKAYVSQGVAVQRAAKEQKALGPVTKRQTVHQLRQISRTADRTARSIAAQQIIDRKAKAPDIIHSTDPRVLKAAGFNPPGWDEKLIHVPANAVKDALELGMTTPTSLAHMAALEGKAVGKSVSQGSAKPLGKAQVELGKEFIQPYKQAWGHGDLGSHLKSVATFATEHPVTSYLMFSPSVKVPLRAAGRVARSGALGRGVAGAQSLARPAATLHGTTLRQARVGSRDVLERAKQAREDRANPNPQVSTRATLHGPSELQRRVDEAFDASRQHHQAAAASAAREAQRRFKHLPKAARKTATEDHLSGAQAGASQHVQRQFVREFGSHWQRSQHGGIVKPKRPDEMGGVIHAAKADAEAVAKRLESDPNVKWQPHVMEVEGGWGVVPRQAWERWNKHQVVGSSTAVGAITLRATGRGFRKTVLPFNPRWLAGQAVEGAVRGAVHGVGPLSYIRGRRLISQVERGAGREFTQRTVQPSLYGKAGLVRGSGSTLGRELEKAGLEPQAAAAAKLHSALRPVTLPHRAWSHVMFNEINGRLEQMYKVGMLGRSVKRGPLMDRHVLGISNKAMKQAAEGLRNTSEQVELGRAIDRAYGKYAKFSARGRENIMHTTPFFPWMRNMAEFVFGVLPRDHPVATGLLASMSEADKEWRKAHGLSLYGKNRKPDWMLGGYPVGDKVIPVGHYMPFVPGQPVSSAAGQVVPQMQDVLAAAKGVDWKGAKIPGGEGRHALNAILTAAESMVPGVAQVDRVTGLGQHYIAGKTNKPSIVQGKSVPKALVDLLNPVKPIGGGKKKKKAASRSSGGYGGGYGGGGYR